MLGPASIGVFRLNYPIGQRGLPVMMTRMLPLIAASLLLVGFGGFSRPGTAQALDLSISPIQVHLAATQKSANLVIGNPNESEVTIQVSTFLWTQDAKGEDVLTKSPELLAFPQMLKIKSKAERVVRVGVAIPDRSVERTYRLLIEPVLTYKPNNPASYRTAAAVIIARASVPVFLRPAKDLPAPATVKGTVEKNRALFQIANPGGIHMNPPAIRLKGLGPTGEVVFEDTKKGWYILAGITRTESFELPEGTCVRLAKLMAEIQNGQQVETVTIPVQPAQCQ